MTIKKPSQKSALEESFFRHWKLLFSKLPEPERQYPILNPESGRFWKIDFCWPPEKICVEIQGGAWSGGGHNTALGQAKDYARQNYLTRNGWRCYFYNSPMLKNMAAVTEEVAEILTNAK